MSYLYSEMLGKTAFNLISGDLLHDKKNKLIYERPMAFLSAM